MPRPRCAGGARLGRRTRLELETERMVQPPEGLQDAIRRLHGCESRYVSSHAVVERSWQGTVRVFALEGHPTALVCYAWRLDADDPERARCVAVLREGVVDGPVSAVRAVVLQE